MTQGLALKMLILPQQKQSNMKLIKKLLLCANMCVYNFLEIEAKNKKNLGAPL
jgi:hypothetical protein